MSWYCFIFNLMITNFNGSVINLSFTILKGTDCISSRLQPGLAIQ